MIASRWRLPEAPRPSRASSRGTAAFSRVPALVLALVLSGTGGLRAAATPLLEPGGRALCTGQPGPRVVTAVVPDGTGGQFIVTTDDRSAGFTASEWMDLFLIHLDAGLDPVPFGSGLYSGSPCGALLFGGAGVQWAPRAAAPAPGRLLLAIESVAPWSASRARVLVQEYDAAGNELLGRYPVPVSDAEIESVHPLILPDGEGGTFFAWNEQPIVYPSQLGDFLLQRLDAGGRPVWDRPAVLSGGPYGGYVDGSLAPDGRGGVYVSWSEPRPDETNRHFVIRVQRVAGDGTLLWPRGGLRPWDGEFADDLVSHVVPAGPDGVIVIFAAGEARAQKMSPGGDRLWGGQGIVLSSANLAGDPASLGTASSPGVLTAADGDLFVTWEEARGSGEEAIAARRLGRDGRLLWPAPVTLVARRGRIGGRSQTLLSDGSLAVVWEESSAADSADPQDLRVQALDLRGRLKAPPGGAPLAVVPGRQQVPFAAPAGRPIATPAGTGPEPPQALFVWSDSRSVALESWYGSDGFYAQVVAFSSSPIVEPVPALSLAEGSTTTIVLHGDDLHSGLAASAGEDIAVEAAVLPDSADGPGDTLTLRLTAGQHAPPGPRALSIVNPDGGATTVPALLTVVLDPRRVDIDRSGRVDGFDLAVLARAFGREKDEEYYSPAADVDADGLVDGTDLAILAARFGDSI